MDWRHFNQWSGCIQQSSSILDIRTNLAVDEVALIGFILYDVIVLDIH